MGKGFSKYIGAFDYFDKALTFLSPTCGGISIALFANVIGVPPLVIASASFSSAFF